MSYLLEIIILNKSSNIKKTYMYNDSDKVKINHYCTITTNNHLMESVYKVMFHKKKFLLEVFQKTSPI